jgi:hypothetical protein
MPATPTVSRFLAGSESRDGERLRKASEAGTLSTVPEEEQHASEVRSGGLRGTKRSRAARKRRFDGDVEMADGAAGVAGAECGHLGRGAQGEAARVGCRHRFSARCSRGSRNPAKVNNANAGTGQRPSDPRGLKPTTKAAIAAPKPSSSSNQLDTDESFLKAVNSMKRGKKHEDDFDREFNQLRITKPRNVNVDTAAMLLPLPPPSPPRAFLRPSPLRGMRSTTLGMSGSGGILWSWWRWTSNEGPVAKSAPPARNNDVANPEWIGKPNFKKFKTVWVFFTLSPPLGMLTSEWTTEKHSAYRAPADGRARYQRGERLWYRKWYCIPFFRAHVRLIVTQLLFL